MVEGIDRSKERVGEMTILDRLNHINRTLVDYHRRFEVVNQERADLESTYESRIGGARQQIQQKRSQAESLRDDVLKYYRIAKDNTDKDLVSSGVPAQKPNIAKLNDMIVRINDSSRNDSVAGEIVDLSSRYLAYIAREMESLDQEEQSLIRGILGQKDLDLGRIESSKRRLLHDCETYLLGRDIQDLASLFGKIEESYEIGSSYFTKWGKSVKKKKMMLIGYGDFKVDVPRSMCPHLKTSLGKFFDETKRCICYPCGFTTTSSENIYVEYTERNEGQTKRGIQALVLNFMRYFKPSEFKVSIFDTVYYNADVLGPLASLGGIKNGLIEDVPYNDKTLRLSMESLSTYYRNVESMIGTSSVYEYNSAVEPRKRIPLRIIVLNKIQETYEAKDSELSFVLNNASKFGITVLRLTKSTDGGSKGKDRERKRLLHARDYMRLISDASGAMYIEDNAKWVPFRWIDAPARYPEDFLPKVKGLLKPVERGTKYFDRYKMALPSRSKAGKRRPIELPFAIDVDDSEMTCSFENETFAAYIMGASGSGKSTLLHTLICGILMGYHPDEVELWLMDFKMLEFKRYVDNRPPHVKYLLLEKSVELVFDIVDRLTEELERREYVFAQNGWQKLGDVPPDCYMPAVFVIIDEFAQMSQILAESKGSGYGSDYTIKLENLLAKGRALGFKFIFASQNYTTGITGLTEGACKQIQLRFALKNTPDEIKSTLNLTPEQITSGLSRDISSLPAYETLFKWRDGSGEVRIGRFRNMYAESAEIDSMVSVLRKYFTPSKVVDVGNDQSCVVKNPVMVDGEQPKTFQSQIPLYKQYERTVDEDYYEDDDVLIYPGVPCSFNLSRPFVLCQGTSENVLIVGGDRDSTANVTLSIIASYIRTKLPIEIWSHARAAVSKKYKATVFSRREQYLDLADICSRITELKQGIQHGDPSERLVICFGLEKIFNDLDIMGEVGFEEDDTLDEVAESSDALTFEEVQRRVALAESADEKQAIIDEYNRQAEEYNSTAAKDQRSSKVYDARDDFEWLVKRGPAFGLHFVCCFDQAKDWSSIGVSINCFNHKILFPMSRDDSIDLIGTRKASEIDTGTFVYTDGKAALTMRPHIFKGVLYKGWMVNPDGNVVRKGGANL